MARDVAAGLPQRPPAPLAGLDLLATAVVVLDEGFVVRYANPAAEQLLDTAARALIGQSFLQMFAEFTALEQTVSEALGTRWNYAAQNVSYLRPGREPLQLACFVSRTESPDAPLVVELRSIEQMLRIAREERLLSEQQVYRELIRNLAHEIRNPLGGIRGAAQLLERELPLREQREFTQVIIAEADRLQSLVDRLLAPHRAPRVVAEYSVHEICERVRAVILAEFPRGLEIQRDYDASMPSGRGDKEQLIQAVLNIVRNAAQALAGRIADGDAQVILRTRVARHVAIARRHVRLAAELTVIDNGPGVAEELKDRIFFPLVSGRDDGTGLGLTLAQAFVLANDGSIEFDSKPGRTAFRILMPLT